MNGDYIPEDIHSYRVNRQKFIIYVGGEPDHAFNTDFTDRLPEPGVEYLMASRFEMNLNMLSEINPKKPILIMLFSCGGDWEAGMQMLSAILYCPNPVTVLAVKWARSMTSLIPLAADRFVIRPPAQYMFHRGTYGFYGLDQEADTDSVERYKSRELMYRIYTDRLKSQGKYSNRSKSWIRELLEKETKEKIDVWFSAMEAREWGFADAVYDGDPKKLRAKMRNEIRREKLIEVLTTPIKVEISIT